MGVIGLNPGNNQTNNQSSNTQKALGSIQTAECFGIRFSGTKLFQFEKDGSTPNAAHIEAVRVARQKAEAEGIERDSDGIRAVTLRNTGAKSADIVKAVNIEGLTPEMVDAVRAMLPVPEYTVRLYEEKAQYDASQASWS